MVTNNVTAEWPETETVSSR